MKKLTKLRTVRFILDVISPKGPVSLTMPMTSRHSDDQHDRMVASPSTRTTSGIFGKVVQSR